VGRKSKQVLYRRSPFLVSYWVDGTFVIQNFCSGVCISSSPLASMLLHSFDDWRSAEEVAQTFSQFTPGSVRHQVELLARHSILQRADTAGNPRERAMESWAAWNPAGGLFHFSSKDVPYDRDWEAAERRLRRSAAVRPPPPMVKSYPGAEQLALPRPHTRAALPRVLRARRTWRQLSARPLALADLGTLLYLTWGVQQSYSLPEGGILRLKTSPSGGALHSIEAYVMALRVSGLGRGIYHYAADHHRLERIAREISRDRAVRCLAGQEWWRNAAAVVFMTAVFARPQWRYPFSRAYRAVLIEAGHLCQTFCLVATWLGLAPFCSMALADSFVERRLGVDGVKESVLYAAGVGARPEGIHWAP
jgi:SagB-type dehydrogenase family enzyme